jgi:hypothetical protein
MFFDDGWKHGIEVLIDHEVKVVERDEMVGNIEI